MGDTRPGPGIIDPDEEPEVTLDMRVREVIAGDRRAVVRRIILYVITAVSLGTLFANVAPLSPGELVAGLIGLAALMLLAMTDQLA